jgi:xanthine/uracil permease
MFRFHKTYFLLAMLLFVTELLIALYLHDRFVRPYVGDFLVVIFLYCFFHSFLKTNYVIVALAVLLIAYIIEVTQYFHLIERLGWQHFRLAHWILGSGFEWIDLVAYTLGIIVVISIEKTRRKKAEPA